MVSSYTARNRLNKQATGDNTNTWGEVLNAGVFELADFALDGWASVNPTGGVTLTTANGAADQARARCLKLVTAVATAVTTIPAVEKFYLVWNATAADQTIASAGGGTSVTVLAGEIVSVITDGTNVKRLTLLTTGSNRLQNVADPMSNQDAATKKYVDNTAFNANSGVLPGQGGNSGKYLSTDGSVASWAALGSVTGGGLVTGGGALPGGYTLAVSAAVASDVRTGTSTSTAMTPGDTYSALAEVTLTDAVTIAVDMSTFLNAVVTLGGNRTLGNPSNTKAGQVGRIRIVQDGIGSRTLSYGSNWKFANGSVPTLSLAASAVDFLEYEVVTSTFIRASLTKAWA